MVAAHRTAATSDSGPVPSSGRSQWTATGTLYAAAIEQPSASDASSTGGKSPHPLGHENALNPTAPASAIAASSPTEPGTRPAHIATSTRLRARAAAALACIAPTVI